MAKVYKEYFKRELKILTINFGEYMGPEYSEYEHFILSLAVKKVYAKEAILDKIIKTSNDILNLMDSDELESFIYSYLAIKMSIDNNTYNKDDILTDLLNDINDLFTESLLTIIHKYVEKNDHTTIYTSSKKHDSGKTFDSEHFFALLMVTMMIRLIVPLTTHCSKIYNIPNAQSFIFDVFMHTNRITTKFLGIDPVSKLHSYLATSVAKTESKTVIWDKLSINSVTTISTSDVILNNIITTILIKFDFMSEDSDSNVIKLCDSVIRQEIFKWCFKKQYNYYMKELSDVEGAAGDDDTIISEADMFEAHNRPDIDEFDLLAIKISIPDTIQKIKIREKLNFTLEEYNYYKDTLITHEYQMVVIMEMFSDYFGGTQFMNSIPHIEWVKLVILAKKKLERMGLIEISNYLSAVRENFIVNRRLSPSFEKSIYDHEKYKFLREEKFKYVQSYFDNKKFIKHTIMMLCNNSFISNGFNDPYKGIEIVYSGERIRDKVLDYYSMIIK